MHTVGIIVEYNPLHNGHVHHFEQAKLKTGAEAVVAVMSGSFLQRGEPAMIHKWARTQMALQMGVDLIIELPVMYSIQPAEWFAYGAVSALNATGCVDALCFGSELGELTELQALAEYLVHEPASFKHILQTYLRTGLSYPAAYQQATDASIAQLGLKNASASLTLPNNILGFHYLLALQKQGSSIHPYTIPRLHTSYHDQTFHHERIASATAIRQQLIFTNDLHEVDPFLPPFTQQILAAEWNRRSFPVTWDHFLQPLLHLLFTQDEQHLATYLEVTEGLQHRIKKSLQPFMNDSAHTFDSLLKLLKTKRYTYTKLQRTLLRILLQHRADRWGAEQWKLGVPYLHILGFSDKGKLLLRKMKTSATVPVLQKVTHGLDPMLDLDLAASSVYSLAANIREPLRDLFQPPLQT